jgi:hypothetical protein
MGGSRKFVGLKFDLASLDASLTVCCPTLEVEDGITLVGYNKSADSDRVRDGQGNAVCQDLAKLQLRDLGPHTELDGLHPGAQLNKALDITYEKIVGYIHEAEVERKTVRDPPPFPPPPPQRQIRGNGLDLNRRRMTFADERKYKRAEKKMEDASFAEDEEYGD